MTEVRLSTFHDHAGLVLLLFHGKDPDLCLEGPAAARQLSVVEPTRTTIQAGRGLAELRVPIGTGHWLLLKSCRYLS